MSWIAFVDEELSKELDKKKLNNEAKEVFPEYEFVASCLRVGITIADLKKITYVDAMKILLAFIGSDCNTANEKNATQNDINMLLG